MSNTDSTPPDLRRDRSKDRSTRSGPRDLPRRLPGPEEGGYVDLASIVTVSAAVAPAVPASTRVSIRESEGPDRTRPPKTRAPRRRSRDQPPRAANAPAAATTDLADVGPASAATPEVTQPQLAVLSSQPSPERRLVSLRRELSSGTRRRARRQHRETASPDEHSGGRIRRVPLLLAGALSVTLLVTLALVATNLLGGGAHAGRPLATATRSTHHDAAILAGADPRASEHPVAPVSLQIHRGELRGGTAAAMARDLVQPRHRHLARHRASPDATSQSEASGASGSTPATSTPVQSETTPVTTAPTSPTYTPPTPSSGGGSSSSGGGSSSSGSGNSGGSSSTKSGSTPAFGSGGALGPGSSPDS